MSVCAWTRGAPEIIVATVMANVATATAQETRRLMFLPKLGVGTEATIKSRCSGRIDSASLPPVWSPPI